MAHTMMTTSIRRSRLQSGFAGLVLGLAGGLVCAQTPGVADATREWHYRIVPGDTLSGIAAAYLLDPAGWRGLQQHNRVDDPRRLQPGQLLRVPYDWLRRDPVAAEVIFVQGAASVRRLGSATAEPVRAGMPVRPGDLLRTGPQASATLRFADGSRLLISPHSEVLVEDLLVYGRSAVADHGLRLQRGGVDVQVPPARGSAPVFEIRTPAINLGVRGTEFRARVVDGDAGRSIVEVLEGRVAAASPTAAVAGTVSVDAGYGTHALPQQPIAPPRPLLPAPAAAHATSAATDAPARPNWQPVEGAVGYRAQVFADAQGTALLRDAMLTGPAAQWPIEASLPNGRYLLRVRAIDASGLEGRERDLPFTVAMQPSGPRSELPPDGAVIGGDSVNLRWSLQPDALRYRLQLGASRDLTDLLRERVVVGNDTALALPPGVYHWRVAAMAGAAEAAQRSGAFGPARVFELRAMPPLPELEPVQFSPANLLLRWRPTAAGQGLQVQLASDPAFEQVVFDERTWGAQMQLPRPPAGVYHLRMRSWIGDASAGEFGPAQRLEVPGVPFWGRW